MTCSTRHQIAVVGGLIVMVAVVFSAPGAAAAGGGGAPAAELGGQLEQTQSGTNTSQPNASDQNATVDFANQTSNKSTVTVKRATLPRGGFVVLHADPLDRIEYLETSMIAVSQPLSPGTHRNITLQVQQSPPGGNVNKTQLNETGEYSVALYKDTNDNGRFDFITSGRSADRAYINRSGPQPRLVANAARITIPGSRTPTPTASVNFRNQTTNGSTITVRSVTLPDGGWVVVHSESYLRGGDPLQTAIGLSRYLSPGTHRNVSVALVDGAVQQNQTLVAIPSRDTNGNETYDYVRSDGFQDVAYTAQGEIITDRATATTHAGTLTSTPASTPTPTSTSTPATPPTSVSPTASTDAVTPSPTPMSTPVGTDTPAAQTQEAGRASDGGGWLANNLLLIGVGVVVGGYVVLKLRS